jgi:hypothetical protein
MSVVSTLSNKPVLNQTPCLITKQLVQNTVALKPQSQHQAVCPPDLQ